MNSKCDTLGPCFLTREELAHLGAGTAHFFLWSGKSPETAPR